MKKILAKMLPNNLILDYDTGDKPTFTSCLDHFGEKKYETWFT